MEKCTPSPKSIEKAKLDEFMGNIVAPHFAITGGGIFSTYYELGVLIDLALDSEYKRGRESMREEAANIPRNLLSEDCAMYSIKTLLEVVEKRTKAIRSIQL